jgi:hypothetical protein
MMTLEATIGELRHTGRVCPQPQPWNKLWKLMSAWGENARREKPPVPLILAAWWATSNAEKRERFQQQLYWANEHGVLPKVTDYLAELDPTDWHIES